VTSGAAGVGLECKLDDESCVEADLLYIDLSGSERNRLDTTSTK